MSPPLTSRNPDLARLVQDGYELAILHGHIVISGVPYVNSKGEVRLGTLVSDMSNISGDITVSPITNGKHVAMWAGEHPCDSGGKPLEHMATGSMCVSLLAASRRETCQIAHDCPWAVQQWEDRRNPPMAW